MWWHGSSRTCVSLTSKSSMQIGHVGWDHDVDMAEVGAVGADEWRDSGAPLWPVSASTAACRIPGVGSGACGAVAFSGSFVAVAGAVYVCMGSLSSTCRETFRRLTPNASRSTWPVRTRSRRSLRRLRWMMCMTREVMLTATSKIASTMTRNTHRLGSWPPESK
jgi:hypothetical protein